MAGAPRAENSHLHRRARTGTKNTEHPPTNQPQSHPKQFPIPFYNIDFFTQQLFHPFCRFWPPRAPSGPHGTSRASNPLRPLSGHLSELKTPPTRPQTNPKHIPNNSQHHYTTSKNRPLGTTFTYFHSFCPILHHILPYMAEMVVFLVFSPQFFLF